MLVDFHVERRPRLFRDPLVFPLPDPQQREFSIPLPKPQPAAQKPVRVVQPEAGMLRGLKSVGHLAAKFLRNDLVCIHKQDPRRCESVVPQYPIPFFGKRAIPLEIDHFGATFPRYLRCVIRRRGIHHDHMLEAAERPKTGGESFCLVADRHDDRRWDRINSEVIRLQVTLRRRRDCRLPRPRAGHL